jgi:hypothetical protein
LQIELKKLGLTLLMTVSPHALASDGRPQSNQNLHQLLLSTFQNTPIDIVDLSKLTPGGMPLDPRKAGHEAYKSGSFTTKDGLEVLSVEALTGSESSKAIYVSVVLLLKPCVDQATVSRSLPGTWIREKSNPTLLSYKTKTFTMSVTLQQGSPGCISSFSRSSVPFGPPHIPQPFKPNLQGIPSKGLLRETVTPQHFEIL